MCKARGAVGLSNKLQTKNNNFTLSRVSRRIVSVLKIHLAVRVTAYLGRDNWDRCLVVHGTPVGSRISVKYVCEIENTKHKLKSYFELDQVRPARHWRYPFNFQIGKSGRWRCQKLPTPTDPDTHCT